MPDHDNGYKLLFSHPELMADLLRGFVHEDWVDRLDLQTLEKVNASYVSDRLRDRRSDLVWRVRWGGERWLYVYLLLEFQSTIDPFMAQRVLTYLLPDSSPTGSPASASVDSFGQAAAGDAAGSL